MSKQPTQITVAHVSQSIPQGHACGSPDSDIFFPAPIDLLPDDKVVLDPGCGQPLGVYRDNGLIWQFEGHYISGSFSVNVTTDMDGLKALWAVMGMKR